MLNQLRTMLMATSLIVSCGHNVESGSKNRQDSSNDSTGFFGAGAVPTGNILLKLSIGDNPKVNGSECASWDVTFASESNIVLRKEIRLEKNGKLEDDKTVKGADGKSVQFKGLTYSLHDLLEIHAASGATMSVSGNVRLPCGATTPSTLYPVAGQFLFSASHDQTLPYAGEKVFIKSNAVK